MKLFSLIRFIFPAVISLVVLSCKEETQVQPEWRDVPGEIQVVNSCGLPKAAGLMRDYLRKKGFDVVEVGNDTWWNYEETVIALRNPHWPGKESLAKALKTDNVIPLQNKLKLVDATVYIGKDLYKIIEQP